MGEEINAREILFKAISVKSGKWIEGTGVTDFLNISTLHPGYANKFYLWSDYSWIEVIKETVSQYTGLEDKNGNKIFEGDYIVGNLIKYSPLATRGTVVFDEHFASFGNKNDAGVTLLREINRIEIIGSVHTGVDDE